VECDEIGSPVARVAFRLDLCTTDCIFGLVDTFDCAVTAGEHLVGEGAIAAAEIQHMAAAGNTERVGNLNRDPPEPAANMRFNVGTAVHLAAIALCPGPIPVGFGGVLHLLLGHCSPLGSCSQARQGHYHKVTAPS